MQDSPDAKKPCKGILKTSSSFDRPGARKSAKFDELNVLQTYHPLDKDYGHMKIEEPKTPYNYVNPDEEHNDQLDANLLAEKLRIAANTQTPSFGEDEDLSDEEFPETDEEKVRRMEFERRRKAHYNEFEAVRLARKLIEEEHLEDDEDEEEDEAGEQLAISNEEGTEENKSKTETDYEQEQGEEAAENTGTESDCTIRAESSAVNVRPMDVDHEENSNPCSARQ